MAFCFFLRIIYRFHYLWIQTLMMLIDQLNSEGHSRKRINFCAKYTQDCQTINWHEDECVAVIGYSKILLLVLYIFSTSSETRNVLFIYFWCDATTLPPSGKCICSTCMSIDRYKDFLFWRWGLNEISSQKILAKNN